MAAGFSWIEAESGTHYYVNDANGRVAGYVTQEAKDRDFYKVVDIRKTEVFYKGLANAKRAVEAVPAFF